MYQDLNEECGQGMGLPAFYCQQFVRAGAATHKSRAKYGKNTLHADQDDF
jgi:hypothetical protein